MGHSETKPKRKNYSVYMDESLHDGLVGYAARNAISQGDAYRRAVATLLELERRGVDVFESVAFSADPAKVA